MEMEMRESNCASLFFTRCTLALTLGSSGARQAAFDFLECLAADRALPLEIVQFLCDSTDFTLSNCLYFVTVQLSHDVPFISIPGVHVVFFHAS